MPSGTIDHHWRWELTSDPETLWPLVADTNRFDRDAGLPPVRRVDGGPVLPNGRHQVELNLLGQRVAWVEEPFEWVRPERFSVVRHYESGPIAMLRASCELTPRPGGGTVLDYRVSSRPRGRFWSLAVRLQASLLAARTFSALFRAYDRLADRREPHLPAPVKPARAELAPGGADRLEAARRQLEQSVDPALVERLCELVIHGDALALTQLRPLALARVWQVEPRTVVDLCLHAVRAGLLQFRWELLCPLCRGSNAEPERLAELPDSVHCRSCHIDYQVGFERSVELTFQPNPSIRTSAVATYCVGGPHRSPHVLARLLLAPGETRELEIALPLGALQLRVEALAGLLPIRCEPDGPTTLELHVGHPEGPADELTVAPRAHLTVRNRSDAEQLVHLERTAWRDDALTAAEVLRRQTFRDLFSGEALRPGQPITVGSQTVLFTDLRDSTALYQEIGDAPAFGRVMSHFDLLRDAVDRAGGAVVKTIGDAVMAVFARPRQAAAAMVQTQLALAAEPYRQLGLTLKAGLHHGPCIAVNLNDRLDYFGTTVNLASRLESQSQGHDVILSPAAAEDPELRDWVAATPSLRLEPFEAVLRGFESERLRCARLTWTADARSWGQAPTCRI